MVPPPMLMLPPVNVVGVFAVKLVTLDAAAPAKVINGVVSGAAAGAFAIVAVRLATSLSVTPVTVWALLPKSSVDVAVKITVVVLGSLLPVPLNASVPPLIVVVPLYLLSPDKVCVPVLALFRFRFV